MRFSVITALCAAPLALAGTLQADLVERGVGNAESAQLNPRGMKDKESYSKGSTKYVQAVNADVIIIWVNNGGGAATETVTNTVTVTAAGEAAAAVATHQVIVGGTAGPLVYTPESVEAAVGDMVVFTFMSKNHTATQSAFAKPCEALAGGMDSGFMANVNNTVVPAPQMAMQVTVATPIWFYCKQKGHCGQGMVFSINPTANKTQAMFKEMAIAQNGTGTTAPIAGGSAAPAAPASVAPTTIATAAPAASTAAAAAVASIVPGKGTTNSAGACDCSCLCGVAAFPNAAVQGINAFGGYAGSLPMSSLTL